MEPTRMHFDLETYSEADLKAGGTLLYALHESTTIMCLSFKTDINGEAYDVIPRDNNSDLDADDFKTGNGAVFKALYESDLELHAWNESFERTLMSCLNNYDYKGNKGYNVLGLKVPAYSSYHCSMLRAMYYNLPAGMGKCAFALSDAGVKTVISKSEDGKAQMLQLCKPRKPSANNPATRYLRCDYPDKYHTLYRYCNQDVMCEASISDYLYPIPESQRLAQLMTTRMNAVGLTIDVSALKAAQLVDSAYKIELAETFQRLVQPTFGERIYPDEDAQRAKHDRLCAKSKDYLLDFEYRPIRWAEKFPNGFKPSQRAVFLTYLNDIHGYVFAKMDKATTKSFMRQDMDPALRKIMEVRNEAVRTSLSKLKKFMQCTAPDRKVHDSIKYYGATMTGRFSGAGIQPQNLPSRGLYKHIDRMFKDLTKLSTAEFIEEYRKDGIINVLASSLRGFIKAPVGKKIAQYDYSAIEARIVAWVSDNEATLGAFRKGLCVYREACKKIFGYSHEKAHDLDSGSWERSVAKEYELSLCYGTGHTSLGNKIFENSDEAVDFRCKCTEVDGRMHHTCEAKRLVNMYRQDNLGVVTLWDKMNSAAVAAVQSPGIVKTAGIFKFVMRDIFLFMRLPNGRTLKYPCAEIEMIDTWGNGKVEPQIIFRGADNAPKSKSEWAMGKDFKMYWRRRRMWGSRFFQNACQAMGSDVMVECMMNVEQYEEIDFEIALCVHDELVINVDENIDDELIDKVIKELMCDTPLWAQGLPLTVEGKCRTRFAK